MKRITTANESYYHGDGSDEGGDVETFAEALARSFRDFPPDRFSITYNAATGEYETRRVE